MVILIASTIPYQIVELEYIYIYMHFFKYISKYIYFQAVQRYIYVTS